jgi:eukaryotic-like serine/threonine-protein kinase
MAFDTSKLVGTILHGQYKLVRPIGAGGMGAIFEASHTRLGHKRYAVKMLHPSIASNQEVFQRFRREAEIASELGHDHIVEVHDFNVTPDGEPYMVMELLDGEDLARRISRGALSAADTVRIVGQIASALGAAHAAHIVHRDLKPQNIFLCRRHGVADFVKVVDFGVSKVRDSSSIVTQDHALMGTPFYMSPEQADGKVHEIDQRTDVFALGAMIWEMLTGQMAFDAPTPMGAMYKVVHVDPPPVHTIVPGLPPAMSQVLARALAKKKDDRYDSVLELSRELAAAAQGVAPSTLPPAKPRTEIPETLPAVGLMDTQAPSVSTMSKANGEAIAQPRKPSRAGLWAVVGLVVVGAGGAAAYLVVPKQPRAIVATPETPKAAKPPEKKPDPPPPPPVEKRNPAPPGHLSLKVHLRFDFPGWRESKPPRIKLDGRVLEGTALEVDRGTDPLPVEIDAPGYHTITTTVTPSANRSLSFTLRKKRSSSGDNPNSGFGRPR